MEKPKMSERNRIIVRTSVLGILVNILLASFKALVGVLAHSIAVILDAVNNLSDALSSVIILCGTRLSSKEPDKEHPYGHGRYEYLTSMLVAGLVLYAGITAFITSIRHIIHPEIPSYSPVTLIIVGSAVLTKLFLGRYVSWIGRKVQSDALSGAGKDALFDALLSLSVFVSAVINIVWKLSLEPYIGALIAGVIVRSGLMMLRDTLDNILGRRADRELVDAVKSSICKEPGVFGAYDLILHSYGPERIIGSVHVEVDEKMTASQVAEMERNISERVYQELGVLISTVGVYAHNTKHMEMAEDIRHMVMTHEGILQMHAFDVDRKKRQIHMDLVIDFNVKNRQLLQNTICAEIQNAYPDYAVHLTMDTDF